MAATEQTEITACDVVQFLSMKISFSATFNVNIEFLKKAMLEPILYRQYQKLDSNFVQDQPTTASSAQSLAS